MKRNTLAGALMMVLLAAVCALVATAASAAPLTVDVRRATGWQGRDVQLSCRVDGAAGPTVSVVLVVSDSQGAPVLTTTLEEQSAGEWLAVVWRPSAAGDFSCVATATDSGGATAQSAAAAVHVLALSQATAGRSVRGRPIGVTRFGAGSCRLLLLGGVHGNEYGTPVALALERYLLAHPGALPEDATIDLVACANPDGYAARTRGNARRVDLNRNLPTRNWRRRLDPRDASSLLGLSGGRTPGSEPETRAVLGLLATGYDVVVSLHSRAGVLDCSGPGAKALGRRMSALCGLPLGRVWYDRYITGSLGRYVPQKYGIPIVTVELRSPRLTSGMRAALLEAAR